MNQKKWYVLGTIAGIAGGILGVIELIAGVKSSDYEREQLKLELKEELRKEEEED